VPGPRLVRFTETLAHVFFPEAETRVTP
jgi:hypothetical protein